ncbi:MAG: hypothetical protein EXR72_26370 [Myxococcales bacterium]|nr:hypothetical protein [Myxococcales bacterium]
MTKARKDVGASVRARLLRLAQTRGEDFQLVLTRYANERLLYRLASSPHAPQFILKGAALFTLWTRGPHRATRDVDLLGFASTSASVETSRLRRPRSRRSTSFSSRSLRMSSRIWFASSSARCRARTNGSRGSFSGGAIPSSVVAVARARSAAARCSPARR